MEVLSACPVVRDEVMRLWEEVKVGGERRLEAFERRVLWLRESSTEIFLHHRGVDVDKLVTFNDWDGFLTSLEAAFGEAKKVRRKFRIKPGDELCVVARTTITDEPRLPALHPEAVRWNEGAQRKKYLYIERELRWLTSDQPAGEYAFGGGHYYPRLENVGIELRSTKVGTRMDAVTKRWIARRRECASALAAASVAP